MSNPAIDNRDERAAWSPKGLDSGYSQADLARLADTEVGNGVDPREQEAVREQFQRARVLFTRPKPSPLVLEQFRTAREAGDYQNLYLTNIALGRKSASSTHSPGQLVPVGGEMRTGETVADAVKRHALDKAYVRVAEPTVLESTVDYVHKGDYVQSHLAIERVRPTEVLVPREDDKIDGFEEMDFARLGGYYSGEGNLLGHMRLNIKGVEQDEQISRDAIGDDKAAAVFFELTHKLWEVEKEERISLITELLRKGAEKAVLRGNNDLAEQLSEELDRYINAFNQAKSFMEVQQLWNEFWQEHQDDKNIEKAVQHGIRIKNFRAEMEMYRGNNPAEVLIHAMYIMTAAESFSLDYIDALKDNLAMSGFATNMKAFLSCMYCADKKTAYLAKEDVVAIQRGFIEKDPLETDDHLMEALERIQRNDDNKEHAEEFGVNMVDLFCTIFNFEKDSLAHLLEEMDGVISNVVDGMTPQQGMKDIAENMYTLSEVCGSDIEKLISLAFISPKAALKSTLFCEVRDLNERKRLIKRAVFEARRKLAMAFYLKDLHEEYQQYVTTHDEYNPFKAGWDSVINSDGVVSGDDDQILFSTEVVQDIKSEGSLGRKAIAKGKNALQDFSDIQRARIEVNPYPENEAYAYQIETRTIPMGLQRFPMECTDCVPVLDLMEKFVKEGYVIVDYTGTFDLKKGEKSIRKSLGKSEEILPGEELMLRFAKFGIMSSSREKQEVQVFCSTKEHSSTHYVDIAKKDHINQYGRLRSLKKGEKSRRSVGEVLFPGMIIPGFDRLANAFIRERKEKTANRKLLTEMKTTGERAGVQVITDENGNPQLVELPNAA